MEYETWFCLKNKKTEVTWDLGMVKKKENTQKSKKKKHNEVLSPSI